MAKEIIKETVSTDEKTLEKEYKTMREKILAQEHVDIFVVPTQLYPSGSKLPVSVNGVTFEIPVGIKFKKGVPQCIADAYETSYQADLEIKGKIEKELTGEIKIL